MEHCAQVGIKLLVIVSDGSISLRTDESVPGEKIDNSRPIKIEISGLVGIRMYQIHSVAFAQRYVSQHTKATRNHIPMLSPLAHFLQDSDRTAADSTFALFLMFCTSI